MKNLFKTSPETDLILITVFSSLLALIMFASSAWALFHMDQLASKKAWVPVDTYNSLLDMTRFLTIQMFFYIGLNFLAIAYCVWKARRKYKLAAKSSGNV